MGIIQKIVSTTKGSAKVKARGKLLVIDGIDGSGKTTQFNLLIDSLRTAGYRVETEDFPRYGQDSATLIEKYLNGDYGQLTAEAASILFALDRFDASFKIRQWLDEGTIVVLNRYVTANAGHHGGKISDRIERVKFFKWLDHLEYNTSH
jgi:dTMP kinase